MRRAGRTGRSRRGLTLLELTLALSVTALVGLGVSSMLTMIGTVQQTDREGRSLLLRAHAAQVRLRAYLDPALCVLQHDASRGAVAVWLQDTRGPGVVNLTELRVLWFDAGAETVSVERVAFPAGWSRQAVELADIHLPASSDWIGVMQMQRLAGRTSLQTALSGVTGWSWRFEGATPAQSKRPRATLTMRAGGSATRDVLLAFGLAAQRAPSR